MNTGTDFVRPGVGHNQASRSVSARADALRRWAKRQVDHSAVVVDIETSGRTPWTGQLACVGIGRDVYRPEAGREASRALLAQPGIVVCHTPFDLRWLGLDGADLHPDLAFHDTRVISWLLDANRSYALDDLAADYLGFRPPKLIRIRGGQVCFECASGEIVPILEAPWDELAAYNASDLDVTAQLYEVLKARLQAEGLWELFLRDEVPLCRALLDMEIAGLPFNELKHATLRAGVATEREALETKLRRTGGLPSEFKLNSPKQVAEYLFKQHASIAGRIGVGEPVPSGFTVEREGRLYRHGHYSFPGRQLTASGSASTGSIELVLSNPDDPWLADFVYWRELSKLEGSFLGKFPDYVHEGRLHGTLNRAGTATGRFSSAEPNLQNIPAHGTYGSSVRALIEGPLVLGDYSQLEQRVAAHFSRDPNLLRAYTEGIDVYALAASLLFGGEPEKEHPQRGLMKTGMLALQYGAGAGKLAQLMLVDGHAGATPAKAKQLIEQLRSVFPRFFAWREEIIDECAARGYAETLSGRRRPLPFPRDWPRMRRKKFYGSMSQDQIVEAFALERQAINTVCQGSAADIVAAAMRESSARLTSNEAWLLLQVHDEILWERGPQWRDELLSVVREACEVGHGFDLNVPLVFDAKVVSNWAEKEGGASGMSSLFQERMRRSRSAGMQSRKAADLARASA